MSIDIGDAISRGFDDLTSTRGAAILGIYVVFGLASVVVFLTLAASAIEAMIAESGMTREELFTAAGSEGELVALAPDVSLPVAAALVVLVGLASILVNIVSIRAFASDSDEPIPMDEVTRNLGRTFVFYVIAGILAGILVFVSVFALVVGAVVAFFLLYFTQFAIVIDDAGPVEALKKSYGVVSDNPVEALVLIVVVMAIGILISLPFSFLPISPVVSSIVSNLLSLAVSVFTIATMTDAYMQATGQRTAQPDTGL